MLFASSCSPSTRTLRTFLLLNVLWSLLQCALILCTQYLHLAGISLCALAFNASVPQTAREGRGQ